MPYSVEHLLQAQTNLIAVDTENKIIQALDKMIEHDYSQLPVVDNDGLLLGMITYESIIRAMRSFNVKLEGLSGWTTKVKSSRWITNFPRLPESTSKCNWSLMG